MATPISRYRLAALFTLSVLLIAYELAVMRVFAVGSWSTFGSMVISIALLGYGLAGTLLTFLRSRVAANADAWFRVTGALLGPSMAVAYVLAQLVPFNPVLIATDLSQLWWIGAYYLIYAIPFFVGALFIGVAFVSLSDRIHRLYFWNMLGSGLGGFLVLGLMVVLPPGRLVVPLVAATVAVSVLCFLRWDERRSRVTLRPVDGVICLFIAANSLVPLALTSPVRVSEFKPISYARTFPDAVEVHHSYGPTGEMHAYASSYFHFAPGLSDNASLNLEKMPREAFLGLYIDGGGPIGVMRDLDPDEERYIDYLPMSAPYLLVQEPRVLLLGLGGGIGAFTALYHGACEVHVAEPNPALIRLLREDDALREHTGDLLADPRIRVHNAEPRALARGTSETYDLVEIGLIDSVGLSQTGGYAVTENFVYTVEGIGDYMRTLEPDGILSITVWNRLNPPRNVPKLLSTVIAPLERSGVEHPERRVFVFGLLFSTATVLVKNSDFEAEEIQTLQRFCHRMSFEVSYAPGMEERDKDFEEILDAYTDNFAAPPGENDRSATEVDLLPGDLYHFATMWLLSGRAEELYSRYIFDIRPATDDRPYYTAYLKPRTLGMFTDQLGEISEEWGYLLLLGTFAQSLLFGLIIIVIPMAGRWRELFRRQGGILGVIVYYSCLGLGYMMVEIYLIQRLVFFLSEPIFSTSVVITTMLVISGLGSLYAGRLRWSGRRVLWIAAAGIGVSMLLYMFGLGPLLRVAHGLPFVVRMVLSIVFVAPAAFCLGIPFPTGLSSLSESRPGLLPWAWGMNGALSVTGAVGARLISISTGYTVVLAVVIALYVAAAALFGANTRRRASSSGT